MKRILLAIPFFLLLANTYAQVSVDWIATADSYSKLGSCMITDSIGNIYVASYDQSILLRKYDAAGNQLWEVSSSSGIQFNYEFPSRVFVDPQGNPVIIGYRYRLASGSDYGHIANSLIILKYDDGGNLIYKQNIDGKFNYFSNSKFWAKVNGEMDANGNIFICTGGFIANQPDSGFNLIKVSPAGTTDWIRTKTFPGTFYYVNNMDFKNDLIGMTGTTISSGANVTTWVMDSTGTEKWSSVAIGEGGYDMAFDNFGNSYELTWNMISSSADLTITKYDVTGNQLWNQNYDFGGYELPSSIEFTPDQNLAIMAYGNTYPGNSPYTDWLTIKIDLNGNQIWSQRYDEHTNNDERPYKMIIDPNNNIYVTGIGGPFPGGFNLSKTQFVTVKYDAAGNLQWSAIIDTLIDGNYGLDIAIDNQNGLYVLGLSWSILIHYQDASTTGISNLSDASAFAVYPNPASTHLNVNLSGMNGFSTVEIYDVSGTLVHRQKLHGMDVAEVDVNHLAGGIYFLKLQSEDGAVKTVKWSKS